MQKNKRVIVSSSTLIQTQVNADAVYWEQKINQAHLLLVQSRSSVIIELNLSTQGKNVQRMMNPPLVFRMWVPVMALNGVQRISLANSLNTKISRNVIAVILRQKKFPLQTQLLQFIRF